MSFNNSPLPSVKLIFLVILITFLRNDAKTDYATKIPIVCKIYNSFYQSQTFLKIFLDENQNVRKLTKSCLKLLISISSLD